MVGDGADAVDYELIRVCHKGDIVVSQDYGVTAIALGRGSYAINHSHGALFKQRSGKIPATSCQKEKEAKKRRILRDLNSLLKKMLGMIQEKEGKEFRR